MIGFRLRNCTMISGENAVKSIDVSSGEAVIEAKILGEGPAGLMLAGLARGVSDLAELNACLWRPPETRRSR
jgi:hypothetical protein